MTHQDALKMFQKGQRPSGMSYANYQSMMSKAGMPAMSKADYMKMKTVHLDKMAGEGNDEDMEAEEDARKSEGVGEIDEDLLTVSGSDLQKALDDFELVSITNEDRQTSLLAKAVSGEIDDDERNELALLLKGETVETDEPLYRSLMDDFDGDGDGDSVGEMINVAPFLKSIVEQLDTRLETMTKSVNTSGEDVRRVLGGMGKLMKSLAKHNVQLGQTVAALQGRLTTVENTPVAPRSVTTDRGIQRPMAKSDTADTSSDQLTKSEAFRGINMMLADASARNDTQAMEELANATALLEGSGQIKPVMAQKIRDRLSQVV